MYGLIVMVIRESKEFILNVLTNIDLINRISINDTWNIYACNHSHTAYHLGVC